MRVYERLRVHEHVVRQDISVSTHSEREVCTRYEHRVGEHVHEYLHRGGVHGRSSEPV